MIWTKFYTRLAVLASVALATIIIILIVSVNMCTSRTNVYSVDPKLDQIDQTADTVEEAIQLIRDKLK